jgi:bacteriorhodopsin
VNVTISNGSMINTKEDFLFNTTSILPDLSDFSTGGYSHIVFWFCFAYFSFLAITMYLFSTRKSPDNAEPFIAGHLLAASTAMTATCHFFMAVGVGSLQEAYAVKVVDGIISAPGVLLFRDIKPPIRWIRHVDWAISTSIALLLLNLLAGSPRRSGPRVRAVPMPFVVFTVGLNLCVHVLGLAATLAPRTELSKWTYWIFGLMLFATLLRHLTSNNGALVRAAARARRGPEVRSILRFILGAWSVYPILWAVTDGRQVATLAPSSSDRALPHANVYPAHRSL